MDVPNQFFQINIFLADNGFVSVLKKLAVPLVPAVKMSVV
jgi:hypothetical protein